MSRSASFDLPHSACHALLQSHRVGTLRALAPLPRTEDVRCHCLLHSSAKVSPLLNLLLRLVAAWSAEWLPGGFIVVTPPVNLLALHGGSGASSSTYSVSINPSAGRIEATQPSRAVMVLRSRFVRLSRYLDPENPWCEVIVFELSMPTQRLHSPYLLALPQVF